jgi:hypothetical protein
VFVIYARLWKFQQVYHVELVKKDVYGLNRTEIEEIASRIEQLYYHYKWLRSELV